MLSLFRCNDFGVLDALAAALERGVKVEAILTKRAKGGKKRLRKLWEALEEMGAVVHRYADPVVKYHAKYLVADGRTALVATLNPTGSASRGRWDIVLTDRGARGRALAVDAVRARRRRRARAAAPPHQPAADRRARGRAQRACGRLLTGARPQHPHARSQAVGPRSRRAAARAARPEGSPVSVVGRQPMGAIVPHGKLDDHRRLAAPCSAALAMSALSLDFRREVSIVVETPPPSVRWPRITRIWTRAGESVTYLPGDRGNGASTASA